MQNNWFRKGLVFGIITLFFIGSYSTGIRLEYVNQQSNLGNILYVGGNGTGNYSNIQDAIDNASNEDTVYVYNGTYYENVVINKTIFLIGEDKNSVYVYFITIQGISLCSLCNLSIKYILITNANNNVINDCNISEYIRLENGSDNNIIHNNTFIQSWVYLTDYSNYNIIENNTFLNSINQGVMLDDSYGNIVQYNHIENVTGDGIRFSNSIQTKIKHNTLINAGITITGVVLSEFFHEIENNTVNGKPIYYYKNQNNIHLPQDCGEGIFVNCQDITVNNVELNHTNWGIELAFCENAIINETNFSNPTFGCYIVYSNNVIIQNCSFERYSHSLHAGSGISVHESEGCIIEYNKFSNYPKGIRSSENTESNFILNNIFYENTQNGIELYHSNYQIISQNDFLFNKEGINIRYDSNNNIIYHNNFIHNYQNAYDACNNIWDDGYPSGGNYWDDYTGIDNYHGPNQNIPGFDGIGDTPHDIAGGSNQDNYPLMQPWFILYIDIDIKPGSYPNSVNPKSNGKLPVAILTTLDFNANVVVPESIDFLSASPLIYAIEDVDDDGDEDMLLHFKIKDLDFSLLVDEGGEYPNAYLYGRTNEGQSIEGKDTIRLVQPWQFWFEQIYQRYMILLEWLKQFF